MDVRPSQGRTLAVMQFCGGSQSFNVVNTLRLLGRWMRMFTIPNQSSVPMTYREFDDAGRMRPSAYYDRVVDVMEELFKFTLLLRGRTDYLTDRYSERRKRSTGRSRRYSLWPGRRKCRGPAMGLFGNSAASKSWAAL
jgi:arsenic resistance protein ArsH